MSQGLVERQNLEDIADAIRSKNGSSDTYTPAEMAQAISEIQTADEFVLVQKTVNANGQYNASDDSADGYSGVRVNVPNSYGASDEGKVVSNGALVAQTTKQITANGTHDTTENNSVVVNVPNSYAVADEGKVVSGGALVGQTSRNVTINGTYDTTTNNEVIVDVSGGGGGGDDSFSLKNYIESSGTQWIDTEYVPTQNSVYELVAEFLSGQPSYSMIIGARSAREGTGGNPVLFGPGGSSFQIGWGTRTLTDGISSTPFLNKKIKYIIDKDGYNGNSELNRPCGYGEYNGEDPLTEYSIYLFSLNANGSEYGSWTRCKAKLYRFRIYESGTLVHEYIPYIDSNDVVCIKDTQTGNLFYNAGTGVFTYGTDGE